MGNSIPMVNVGSFQDPSRGLSKSLSNLGGFGERQTAREEQQRTLMQEGIQGMQDVFESRTRRDILQDTNKFEEAEYLADKQIRNQGQQLESTFNDKLTELDEAQFEIDEFKVDPITGQQKANPAYTAINNKRAILQGEYNLEQKNFQKKASLYGAGSDAERDNLVNAEGYSNRVYEQAIKRGLSAEIAKEMKSDALELFTRPKMTDREKFQYESEEKAITAGEKADRDAALQMFKTSESKSTSYGGKGAGSKAYTNKLNSRYSDNAKVIGGIIETLGINPEGAGVTDGLYDMFMSADLDEVTQFVKHGKDLGYGGKQILDAAVASGGNTGGFGNVDWDSAVESLANETPTPDAQNPSTQSKAYNAQSFSGIRDPQGYQNELNRISNKYKDQRRNLSRALEGDTIERRLADDFGPARTTERTKKFEVPKREVKKTEKASGSEEVEIVKTETAEDAAKTLASLIDPKLGSEELAKSIEIGSKDKVSNVNSFKEAVDNSNLSSAEKDLINLDTGARRVVEKFGDITIGGLTGLVNIIKSGEDYFESDEAKKGLFSKEQIKGTISQGLSEGIDYISNLLKGNTKAQQSSRDRFLINNNRTPSKLKAMSTVEFNNLVDSYVRENPRYSKAEAKKLLLNIKNKK